MGRTYGSEYEDDSGDFEDLGLEPQSSPLADPAANRAAVDAPLAAKKARGRELLPLPTAPSPISSGAKKPGPVAAPVSQAAPATDLPGTSPFPGGPGFRPGRKLIPPL